MSSQISCSGTQGYEVGCLLKGTSHGSGIPLGNVGSWDEIEGRSYIHNFLSGDHIEVILVIVQELKGKSASQLAGFGWLSV